MPTRKMRDSLLRSSFATLAVAAIMLAAVPGGAQDRSTLIRALQNDDFRVRIQAAFAMGSTGDRALRPHLERTLQRDRNPAVRAAAATGLGRLGDPGAVAALRAASRDGSSAVRAQAARSIELIRVPRDTTSRVRRVATAPRAPNGSFMPTVTTIPTEGEVAWPRVRYVVVIGDVRDQSGFRRPVLMDHLRGEVTHQLRLVRNIALFMGTSSVDGRAQQEIRRRSLPQLRVDANLAKVESRMGASDVAVRCEVSLMVLDEPGRNLRGMLRGAATGMAPRASRHDQVDQLARQAVSAAVRSAMSSAEAALTAAAAH
jgi:hypothetical protein